MISELFRTSTRPSTRVNVAAVDGVDAVASALRITRRCRSTQVGKYTKLVELLAELQFPEVVCLQEAYDLVEISRGGKSALTDRMYSMFADKYAINFVGRDGRVGSEGRLPDHPRSR